MSLSWYELTSSLMFPSYSLGEMRRWGVRLDERDGQAVRASHHHLRWENVLFRQCYLSHVHEVGKQVQYVV
jgi:hypothetical protein